MTKLLSSLVEMPTYLTITFAIALVSMLTSFLKILMRSRAKFKIGKSLKVTYIVSIVIVFATLFYNDHQVKKAKESVFVTRYHNIVKISSNSQFLKSAKFQILAENKDYVFIEGEDDGEETIFKVEEHLLKEKTK